ncbi:MAG: hypothetical protein NXH97_22755 [Rhodobacteraceae bacterium]|nr:hypothetical protein [Paracoccaceae bacterium]
MIVQSFDEIIVSKSLRENLDSTARLYSTEAYSKAARREGARHIAQLCKENGCLSANGGGYGLASEAPGIRKCSKFNFRQLLSGKTGRRRDEGIVDELQYRHCLHLKAGRTPVGLAFSPYGFGTDPCLPEGLTCTRISEHSWYAPGHCSTLLVHRETTRVVFD